MSDPKLIRDGNLRFACLSGLGWPIDPLTVSVEVRRLATQQGGTPQGPIQVFIAGAPDNEPPAAWECHIGLACTGMPKPGGQSADGQRLMIEDYRNLVALTVPHRGPVRELGQTWQRLADHAKTLGHRLRPYWRVILRRKQLADGNILPSADVAVFLDQ